MKERLIELWLDSASERSFQFPFAASLVAEGYSLLHVTRHCALEFGKDIIARDKYGKLHAFQLKDAKGHKITKETWLREMEPQCAELCDSAIIHASVEPGTHHKPWFVINGDLNEETHHYIHAKNLLRPRNRRIEVVLKGNLQSRLKSLGGDFWPERETSDFTPFLEIFLTNGTELFPKEKLSRLLQSIVENAKPSRTKAVRLVNSLCCITSVLLGNFQARNNHFAEFEGWMTCLATVLWTLGKCGLTSEACLAQIALLEDSALGALERLCDETSKNKRCGQGSPFSDVELRSYRTLMVAGALSTYALWRRFRGEPISERDKFIAEYIDEVKGLWRLPGECGIPFVIAMIIFNGVKSASLEREALICRMLVVLATVNHSNSKNALTNPYVGFDEAILLRLGLEPTAFPESFDGCSYFIKSLFQMLARSNFKQACTRLWPSVSRIAQEEFVPGESNDYYLWRCERGELVSQIPIPRQKWADVRSDAFQTKYSLPSFLCDNPGFALAFGLVYPHRCVPELLRLVDQMSASL